LSNFRDHKLYCLFRGDKIEYLGLAYNTPIYEEIPQRIKKQNISPQGLETAIGYPLDSNLKAIHRELILDSEYALIATHQTEYNVEGEGEYAGTRNNLRVINRIFNEIPLRDCVEVKKGKAYKTCYNNK
jgi:hypothetical protein